VIKRVLGQLKKSERGVSIIEFAVILPILLALFMGLVEFGWIYTGYITVNGAAREGARLAARGEDAGDVNTRVRNHAQFVLDAGGNVSVTSISADVDVGGEVTVGVSGSLPLLIFGGRDYEIIPFPRLPDPFPLSSEATMRREY